jgi:DNA-binding CsgD family transcriptional regulator
VFSDDHIAKLVRTLYAAPATPELWNEFLAGLAKLTNTNKMGLLSHDLANDRHNVVGRTGEGGADAQRIYEAQYGQYDEWFLRGRNLIPGKVHTGQQIWPESHMLRSLYYNEFLRRFDMRWMVTVTTASTPTLTEHLTLCRGPSEGLFEEHDLRVVEALVPHLQTALTIRRLLQSLQTKLSNLEAALDLLETPLLLLDASKKIVFMNSAASSILDEGTGFCFAGSILGAKNASESARLQELIAKAILAGNGLWPHSLCAMQVSRTGRSPLRVLVSPFRFESPSSLPGRAAVAVFLSDPERQPSLPSEILRLLFGLSAAETQLALQVFDGFSLSDAAERNCVGRETIKSQMSSIFRKTGTRRQAELVQLMANLSSRVPRLVPRGR